jgi:hypothetical protein
MEEPLSLVQQIQHAPDLWDAARWIVGILASLLVAAVGFSLHLIYGRVKVAEQDLRDIERVTANIKLDIAKNYVTNAQLISTINSFKAELHNSIDPVRKKVDGIEEFLRNGKE